MVRGANSAEHQAWFKVDDIYKAIECLSSSQPERNTEFVKLTVRDINGKPYYSIIYLEDGNEFEGYSSYSLDVVSDYLKEYFIPYQNFSAGCYCRSYRGGLYLVLTPEVLAEKQIRKMVNRNVWFNSVYIDNSVVIFIHNANEEEKLLIKEIVTEKIPFIMEISNKSSYWGY